MKEIGGYIELDEACDEVNVLEYHSEGECHKESIFIVFSM